MCELLHNFCELGGSFARGRPSLAHYVQGISHLRWCRISSINSMCKLRKIVSHGSMFNSSINSMYKDNALRSGRLFQESLQGPCYKTRTIIYRPFPAPKRPAYEIWKTAARCVIHNLHSKTMQNSQISLVVFALSNLTFKATDFFALLMLRALPWIFKAWTWRRGGFKALCPSSAWRHRCRSHRLRCLPPHDVELFGARAGCEEILRSDQMRLLWTSRFPIRQVLDVVC